METRFHHLGLAPKGFLFSNSLSGSTPPPLVISTGAAAQWRDLFVDSFLEIFRKIRACSLFRGLICLGLVVRASNNFPWLGIAQNDPGLVFNGIGIGLQMLHVVLQAAILLLQFRISFCNSRC